MTTERPSLGIQQLREHLRERVDKAWAAGEITVVTRHGVNVAALVPYAWLERADAALTAEPEDSADEPT